eukprot:4398478-Pleurochrysis_carterae.AAC.1
MIKLARRLARSRVRSEFCAATSFPERRWTSAVAAGMATFMSISLAMKEVGGGALHTVFSACKRGIGGGVCSAAVYSSFVSQLTKKPRAPLALPMKVASERQSAESQSDS